MRLRSGGLALRIAVVAMAASATAIGILALGVWVVGGETFAQLMMEAGDSAEHAHAMFDASLRDVLVLAVSVAVAASVGLAVVLSRRIARPLAEVGEAARRVAGGDYDVRVPPPRGPEELVSLAGSFNRMAADLEAGERQRRDIIANTAHELRTPLTNLVGYIEGLRDGVVPADRRAYDSLLEELERLTRLARSLDDLAMGDLAARSGHPVVFDLAAQLTAAADLMRATLEQHGLALERRWPPRLLVRADADQVAQVVVNLLQNAARYTPDGGRIVVSAEQLPEATIVSVADSGAGIPESDLPHLFERFYRVDTSRDRDRGGAGIGLAIVKQLVEGWGGRVGVESTPGLTRFWFSLPTSTG